MKKLLAMVFVGVFSLMIGMSAAYACGHGHGDTPNDTPNDTPTDTPSAPSHKDAPAAVTSGETVGLPDVFACDTDWERATYRECFGLPYDLLLQDKDLLGVDYAVPATRIGFDN